MSPPPRNHDTMREEMDLLRELGPAGKPRTATALSVIASEEADRRLRAAAQALLEATVFALESAKPLAPMETVSISWEAYRALGRAERKAKEARP